MPRLFLIDAYALIFRFYYAFLSRPMRNREGVNTSAIFGFTKFLNDIIKREHPDYLGVAFDPHGGNFRNELYPLYKANRSDTPEDIIASVPYIKLILVAMGIPVLEVQGYEADDVIGTLSGKASDAGYEVYMVTPDKDYGQLVRDHVYIYKQRKGSDGIEIIGRPQIKEHYGVEDPREVIDILALWGDASDNIPGVAGIGEKGAIKLVNAFGPVENLLANLGELKGKQRENIEASLDQILLSKRLATIAMDVPIDFEPEKLVFEEPDCDRLREIYAQLGFSLFLRELDAVCGEWGSSAGLPAREGALNFETVWESGRPAAWVPPVVSDEVVPSREALAPGAIERGSEMSSGGAVQRDLFGNVTGVAPGSRAVDPVHISSDSQADRSSLFDGVNAGLYRTIRDIPHQYHQVQTPEELAVLVKLLQATDRFCFDTETTGLDVFNDRLVGISFAITAGEAYYVVCPPEDRVETQRILDTLKPVLENEKIAKIGQNIKFDYTVLKAQGVSVRGFFYDTMILHYLLDPESRHNMDYLARNYLDYLPISIEELIGRGAGQLTMDRVDPALAGEYSCEDADVTLRLYERLWPEVSAAGFEQLYVEIEEPLIRVLGDMEMYGVRIDSKALKAYGQELTVELDQLEAQIRRETETPDLNVNSAKQLGEVLFGKLKIDPKPKMTKTKQYRTDEEYLQGLSDRSPIIAEVLVYRGLRKLLSTYINALPELVNSRTGRIHTSFNQAVTATGRLSSTHPNLQNIPIRESVGREIRKAFVPSDEDHLILSADYSQVELRLMAHLSADVELLGAFAAGLDVHTATAAKIFKVSPDKVMPEQRRRAKTANFGIIYGISAFGLSQRLGIPRSEAKALIEGYFESYPGVKRYIETAAEHAKEQGSVATLFGRKRLLPDIYSSNANVRGLAERNAVNAPIQGSAADIIKIAMARVSGELEGRGLRSRVMLQVHDELVIDLLKSEEAEVRDIVVKNMEGAVALTVPLLVEVGVGNNWLEAH